MTYFLSIKSSIFWLFLMVLPTCVFSQSNWQLVFKIHDIERNNAVTYQKSFPFQEGELNIENAKWQVEINEEAVFIQGGMTGKKINVSLTLLEGEAKGVWGVQQKIENWSLENYVLMPGVVYQGNRFEVRKMPYSPRLWDNRDIKNKKPIYINDIPRLNNRKGTSKIQLTSGAMSFPSMSYRTPDGSYQWLLTRQANNYGDYLYSIEESNDRQKAWLTISSPAVREGGRFRFCCSTDDQAPDKFASFKKGDELTITFWNVEGNTAKITEYFATAKSIRELVEGKNDVLESYLPLSKVFEIQEKKFNEQNWIEHSNYYSVGAATSRDYHVGWTGGTFTTYVLWMMGDEISRQRVIQNYDWLFNERITEHGFFWDRADEKGAKLGGHGLTPNWHMTRRNADGIYFALKHFLYMREKGEVVKEEWLAGTKKVVDAFVNIWKREGQFGQFINNRTGEIMVNGTAGGAAIPAAFVLASKLFNDESYIEVAKETTQYFYENFTKIGLTYGGPGDVLQAPESESAFALFVSYMALYGATDEAVYLQMGREAADQFLTWIVTYNYEFPETSTYGKLGLPSKGGVIANAQNTTAPAGICTFSGIELLKFYRATGEKIYLETLLDITRLMPHHLNQGERILPGMKEGWLTERINMNDGIGDIGEYVSLSTWAESALLLANAELPSIYVDLEAEEAFTFDHVETKLVKKGKRWLLEIHNLTKHDATVTIVTEDAEDKKNAWNDFFRIDAKKITIASGTQQQIKLN